MFAKIISNVVTVYPYSYSQLYADNPSVSFPPSMDAATMATYNMYVVNTAPPPAYDLATQKVVEGTPVFVDPNWVQSWTVVALTPAEEEAYKDFFIGDAKINTITYLDDFARTRDYVDADRCCSYTTSSDPQLQNDADYMVLSRDSVIPLAYSILADIKLGVIPVPTMDWFMAQLPPLAWPVAETWPAVNGMGVL
jgi:hypothetical protein